MPTKVDGIDYTPAGIEALREDVIVYRDRAIEAFPEGAEMAVVLSHTLALLAYLKELIEDAESARRLEDARLRHPGVPWTNPLTDMES